MKLLTHITNCTDPYENLALERYLLETVAPDEIILYLWQNANTVVIGRNQSALAECRVSDLLNDGGKLARRLSGGGAVYHDLGNYNFTFLMPTAAFDEKKQTDVVLRAVQLLGIPATKTGRNDLLANGAKFSGHAYYHTKKNSYHHGTLLVDVDTEKMQRYLNPAPQKLKSKGVASVKSRVCNLKEFAPSMEICDIPGLMIMAFEEVYGEISSHLELGEEASRVVSDYVNEFKSDEWLYRGEQVLTNSSQEKFDWGLARLDWSEEGGSFSQVAFYTDGLEPDLFVDVDKVLLGTPVNKESITQALVNSMDRKAGEGAVSHAIYANDIASLLDLRKE